MTRLLRSAWMALAASLLVAAQATAQVYQGPDTGSVASGVVVTTETFSRATSASFGGPAFKEPRNKVRLQRVARPLDAPAASPSSPTAYVTDSSVGGVVRTAPPPIPLVSVDGMRDPGNYIPPDPYIAAGPDHVIVVDNGKFRILNKQGLTLGTIQADAWFSSAVRGASAFDPKVTFDHFAGRWIMVWLDQSDAEQRSYFLVSVSDDADPLGIWYNWALPAGVNGSTPAGNWADYQGVGFDQHALYITSNNWQFEGFYDYSKIRIIPKADLYANTGGRVRWTDFWGVRDPRGNPAFTIRPVIVYGAPDVYHLVSFPLTVGGSSITLFTLSNPLTSPTLTARTVGVGAWSEAPSANQLGGSVTPIETAGSSISNEPIYRDSSIWLVHSVGTGGQYSSVRYMRINTTTAILEEDGALGAPGYWYFYPAIAVDKDKNVAITYSRSGQTEYIGGFMTWRLASDPPGALRPSVQLQAGKGNYVKTFGAERNRWGDYLGIALDPRSQQDFWMYSQYAADKDLWGNWLHNVRLTQYPVRRILAERPSHSFRLSEAGTTSDTAIFQLYNVGATPLTISSVSVSSPAFRLVDPPPVPVQLATWDPLVVRAVFAPAEHGEQRDSIVVVSDDASHPAVSLALTGKGVEIGTAQPGTIYAIGGYSPARLYRLDRQTGTSVGIGPTGVLDIRGLAVHPVSREIHGSAQRAKGTDIVRISSGFGDALPLRTIPLDNIRGFVYLGPDTILAVAFTPGKPNGMVYRIGPADDDTLTLSTNPSLLLSGLARDPSTGTLWASATPPVLNRDRVYFIDPASGAPSLIGSSGLGQGIASLVLDPSGTLYGLQVNGAMISIDPLTGAGSLIGATGINAATAITMLADAAATDVNEKWTDGAPTSFGLEKNYPNPFNPTTAIRFRVSASPAGGQAAPTSSVHVKLTVYDLLGREVAVLVDEQKTPGSYSAVFNASGLASGVYLYRLTAGTFVETRKMVLMR